ncbi:MAG: hypothetical protein ACRC57_06555 [Sarcina sp.]
MQSLIILIVILALILKGSITGKQKKLSLFSIILLPAIYIYFVYSTVEQTHNILPSYYLFFIAAIAIGAVIGLIRSRFYEYKVAEDGTVLSRRKLTDAIILICYVLLEVLIRFGFSSSSFLTLISLSLLFVGASSICVRRIIVLIKYLNLISQKETI